MTKSSKNKTLGEVAIPNVPGSKETGAELQKDQEKALIADTAFRAIIENSTEKIALISKDGILLYVSP